MINLLLTVSILVWPFGQLLMLSPWGSASRLQLLDVLALLLFLSLLIDKKSRQKIVIDPLAKPLTLFSLAALLSLVVNAGSVSLASIAYFLRFVSYTSYYFAFRLEGVKKYSRYLVTAAALFTGLGLLQYFFLPDVRFLAYLGFDDHYYRLIGSLLDPNFTGLILAVLVVISPPPLLLIPLIALVLTFSRASFLALAVGLVYLSLTNRRFKLLLSLFFLSLFLYLVPKPFGEGVNLWRTFSIVSRFENQKNALVLFVQKPILGHGFNTLKQTGNGDIPNLTSGVDNSFLFVLATTGLAGFIAFLYFLKTAFRGIKLPAIKAALIIIFVHALFNNSLFYTPVLALFFLLVSLRPKRLA